VRGNYITAEGFAALESELDHLQRVERRKVTAEVSAAAALGDRSENAEYIYGKKRLREIDRRIRFLSKRLDQLTVVDRPPPRTDVVYFGATVSLDPGDGGEPVAYRVVGVDEADAARGSISLESPLGRALLGKACGDRVRLSSPRGEREFEILAIHYGG
jgi:transcription elongation factor GreB